MAVDKIDEIQNKLDALDAAHQDKIKELTLAYQKKRIVLEEALIEEQKANRKVKLKEAKDLVKKFGLTPSQVFGAAAKPAEAKAAAAKKEKPPVKYLAVDAKGQPVMDEKGKQVGWSGRGNPPQFFKDMRGDEKKLAKYLIVK